MIKGTVIETNEEINIIEPMQVHYFGPNERVKLYLSSQLMLMPSSIFFSVKYAGDTKIMYLADLVRRDCLIER